MDLRYRGKDREGNIVEGVRSAADKLALAREMRAEGITVLSAEQDGGNAVMAFLKRVNESVVAVKLHEKIVFARNLGAMVGAGIPVSRGLAILEKQTTNRKFVRILGALGAAISRGGNLSDGLKEFPRVFSPLFVAMVRAGEESGNLPGALREVSDNLDRSYALTRKVRGALIYPAIIVVAILVIGALMLVYVVPTLTGTFKELKVELPASTKLIIFISDMLTEYTLPLIVALALLSSLAVFLARTPRGKHFIDWGVLRIPVLGNVVRELNAARTARTMASLLSSGVGVTDSLDITRDVLQNTLYQNVMKESAEAIRTGSSFSSSLKAHVDLYPVMVGEMIEVGEETGKLSQMLADVASFYEEEVEIVTKDLSTIIEPLLMVFIGGAVGFFAISMISPTYSLLNNI